MQYNRINKVNRWLLRNTLAPSELTPLARHSTEKAPLAAMRGKE